ncbi:hypothetical protein [Gillisia hiemivivida]|uniref:Uncharacterized protein n=1 Tax=Gillisia hiemivivida TaxID=291190 RepID=A0A5C6ZQ95_9FLAO|nr:hypothetical protein [Gillisia hiemivivida]TXD92671.1 hypothetical protein ES724_12900 [Gillisia hiemivivida]
MIIGLMFLFINCSKEETRDRISYEIIHENSLSYSEENKIPKQFKVFENENEWNIFIPEIERVNPNQAEILKNLNFDFINNNLIIVIGEYFFYCCSEITIVGVYNNREKVTVDFYESGPGELTAVSQAILILKIKKDK